MKIRVEGNAAGVSDRAAKRPTGELKRLTVAAVFVVVTAAAAAGVTVTPAQYDFGKTAVPGGTSLHQFTVSSAPGDWLDLSVTGPNAAEFIITGKGTNGADASGRFSTQCLDADYNPTSSCPVDMDFKPSSMGVKTATLIVANRRGERATVPLRGEGVVAGCEWKVVSCNYGHLYSGTFRWTSGLSAPGSQYSEHVQVDIVNGVATCNGSATQSEQGQSRTGAITGKGLLAVEFERDDKKRLVYRITAACPTPDWPATPDAAGTPSQRAEMGHNDRSTYEQPATAIAQADLTGSSSYPAPETDNLNGVTGAVSISWSLKQR